MNGKQEQESRAKFEHWFSDGGQNPRAVERSANGDYKFLAAAGAWITWQASRAAMGAEQAVNPLEPSPTAGMSIAQRGLHVGGRDNAAGYVEFGSIQAVEALGRTWERLCRKSAAPVEFPAEHISALIEVARMPTQEFVADAHNEAVKHLRTLSGSASQSKKGG